MTIKKESTSIVKKEPVIKKEPISIPIKKEPSPPKRKNTSIDSDDDLPLVCLILFFCFWMKITIIFRLRKPKIKQMLKENQIPQHL